MNLLITLLVYAIVFGLIWWLVMRLPLPAPWGMVAQVLLIVIALVFLFSLLTGGSLGLPALR
jgi:hypothetical protein